MRWRWLLLYLGLNEAANVTEPLAPTGIVRRDDPETTALPADGIAAQIKAGETHYYMPKFDLFGIQQHLSLSECHREPAEALPLSLSTRRFNETTERGLIEVAYGEDDGAIRIDAPKNGTIWSYQVGMAYSSSWYLKTPNLYLVDSDFRNALFVSSTYDDLQESIENTTYAGIKEYEKDEMNSTLLSLFVFDKGNNPIRHLNRSYCALQQNSLLNQANADLSDTNRGASNQTTRGQFFLKGLNRSTRYEAYLGLKSPFNGAIGGASFRHVDFSSKTSESCQVLYNMTFCDQMAFAVPGNASTFSVPELSNLYDNMAKERYSNFSKSLQQISCDVAEDDRYSMFSTCRDCDYSYRQWLCAITIPRCADWENNASYLAPREVGKSRNPEINRLIKPGRYKEILPCRSLCYGLVRTCPLSLGFTCPTQDLINSSYGVMGDDGDVTCSYPGAVYDDNSGVFAHPSLKLTLLCIVFIFIL